MNHWIFVVTDHPEASLTKQDIFNQRMGDRFWGLGEDTPNRKSVDAGDEVLFYFGRPEKSFVGTAVLTNSATHPLNETDQERISHDREFYRARYGVRLDRIQVWPSAVAAEPLVSLLTFIENKQYWFSYFQGGIREVPEHDFKTIVASASRDPRELITAREVGQTAGAEFALESHLEDFMDQNWTRIDFGRRLQRFTTAEQDGRQFPAGPWSIDFLCRDQTTGDLVVVELKRGKSADMVVGQILRYMGWVKENLAERGQRVQGIIIASEIDDSLRYALKPLLDVSALTYKIDFRLTVP